MSSGKIAFLFPGQASQVVGMGRDFAQSYPESRLLFEQADDILGFSLSGLCFDGPDDLLNDTINTQPALYVCGIAILRALAVELPTLSAAMLSGHSLGELTALAAAGVFSFEDGLRLVRERGRLMKAAGEAYPGGMAALMGLESDIARRVCVEAAAKTGGVVVVANDNCPGQMVISGDVPTLECALEMAKAQGARRALKLAVSIAAHSPLMAGASEQFLQALSAVNFQTPHAPVYSNVSAAPMNEVDAIRHELHLQLVTPVLWTQVIRAMIADGAGQFLELGPKDVLTGLLRRIDASIPAQSINSVTLLKQFVQNYPSH